MPSPPLTPISNKRQITSPDTEDKQPEKKPKEIKMVETKIDNILLKLENLFEGQVNIRGDLNWLRTEFGLLKTEIGMLQTKYEAANAEINALKQSLKMNSFVLFGMPPATVKGDAFPILQNYARVVGYTALAREDVRSVYAVNLKDGSGCRISGEFYDLRTKDAIFKLVRKKFTDKTPVLVENVLPDLDIESPHRGKKVYMLQALTPETIAVLNEARKFKGTTFEFVWVKDGVIRVKRDEGARTHTISSVKQLKEIVDNGI